MLDFPYFNVISCVSYENFQYPLYTTCAIVNDKFYVIEDLENYLLTGSEGISTVEVIPSHFEKVTNPFNSQC